MLILGRLGHDLRALNLVNDLTGSGIPADPVPGARSPARLDATAPYGQN
ncbi:hypothetical protein [Streptomyces xinghaiensis]